MTTSRMFRVPATVSTITRSVAAQPGEEASRRNMGPIQGLGDKVLVQVCLIVDDADKYAKHYAEVFGIPIPEVHVTDGHSETKATYFGSPTEAKARIYHWYFGNVGFEILQPLGPESVWQ